MLVNIAGSVICSNCNFGSVTVKMFFFVINVIVAVYIIMDILHSHRNTQRDTKMKTQHERV